MKVEEAIRGWIGLVAVMVIAWVSYSGYFSQQRFQRKLEAYSRAITVVNKQISSLNLDIEGVVYRGSSCGDGPTQEERNDAYATLALVSEKPDIPLNFLKIMTSSTSPIEERDAMIHLMRKDLGFGIIKISGESFVVDKKCLREKP